MASSLSWAPPPDSVSDDTTATYLATLGGSGGRPPTSQGAPTLDLEGEQAGAAIMDIAGSMYDAVGGAEMDEDPFLPNPGPASSTIDTLLDQHAAALDSLSFDHPPVQALTSSGSSMHEFLSQATIHDLDLETSLTPNEEYLNHLNRDRFLSITAFFRHFVGFKDRPFGLDATPTPDVITREDLCGDECDMQGINWALLRSKRDHVRMKRTAFESARLSPHLRAVRQVY
jgi:hypothetical protein